MKKEQIQFEFANLKINFNSSFQKLNLPTKLIQQVECKLNYNEFTAYGYGEAFFITHSIKKARSEAWERFWMKYGDLIIPDFYPQSVKSSNGFAAHPKETIARLKSKLELIERAEVLSSWQKVGIWKRREDWFIKPLILMVKKALTSEWELEIYSLSSFSEYETFIGILIHPSIGFIFDSGTITKNLKWTLNFDSFQVCLKILKSLIRMSAFKDVGIQSIHELPERGEPQDHSRFYRSPQNIAALDAHRFHRGSGDGILKNLELVQTNTMINVQNFPVLCHSHHPDWPILNWGVESLQKSNSYLWPHPIA